jgi:hypothetical protein
VSGALKRQDLAGEPWSFAILTRDLDRLALWCDAQSAFLKHQNLGLKAPVASVQDRQRITISGLDDAPVRVSAAIGKVKGRQRNLVAAAFASGSGM